MGESFQEQPEFLEEFTTISDGTEKEIKQDLELFFNSKNIQNPKPANTPFRKFSREKLTLQDQNSPFTRLRSKIGRFKKTKKYLPEFKKALINQGKLLQNSQNEYIKENVKQASKRMNRKIRYSNSKVSTLFKPRKSMFSPTSLKKTEVSLQQKTSLNALKSRKSSTHKKIDFKKNYLSKRFLKNRKSSNHKPLSNFTLGNTLNDVIEGKESSLKRLITDKRITTGGTVSKFGDRKSGSLGFSGNGKYTRKNSKIIDFFDFFNFFLEFDHKKKICFDSLKIDYDSRKLIIKRSPERRMQEVIILLLFSFIQRKNILRKNKFRLGTLLEDVTKIFFEMSKGNSEVSVCELKFRLVFLHKMDFGEFLDLKFEDSPNINLDLIMLLETVYEYMENKN